VSANAKQTTGLVCPTYVVFISPLCIDQNRAKLSEDAEKIKINF
jgi:hypothetical protein